MSTVNLPDIEEINPSQEEGIKDDKKVGVSFAFLGTGQGGCKVADEFYKLGYNKVVCVNTTEQDMKGLVIEKDKQLIMDIGEGGAGKNTDVGEQAVKKYYESIFNKCREKWGKKLEQIIVCVGGGGGTGSGSVRTLVKLAKEYLVEIKNEDAKVGVICTLPKRVEGTTVNKNAYELIRNLIVMANSGELSPLIIVDNEKVNSLFPRVPVKLFWSTANEYFTSVFDVFNTLAAQNSEYCTFDPADYKDILGSGTTIFGLATVKEYSANTDLSDAIKNNLTKGLLAEGFDLTKAKKAGCIITADEQTMLSMPQEAIDLGLQTLSRMLGDNITLHNGVYEGDKKGVQIFFIISGLDSPEQRIEQLKKLGRIQ